MSKTYSNPCVRCGTERIVVRTWNEKLGNSTIVNTETACPNKECQAEVNKANNKQQATYMAMKVKSEQRALARKAARDAERAEKNQQAQS